MSTLARFRTLIGDDTTPAGEQQFGNTEILNFLNQAAEYVEDDLSVSVGSVGTGTVLAAPYRSIVIVRAQMFVVKAKLIDMDQSMRFGSMDTDIDRRQAGTALQLLMGDLRKEYDKLKASFGNNASVATAAGEDTEFAF